MADKSEITYRQYKGHDMIGLPSGTSRDGSKQYYFEFGLTKARLIVEHFDAIKTFVEAHETAEEVA